MELSFEIPEPEWSFFTPLQDFVFALAHEPYTFARGCLLDNGMYELGESLSSEQLADIAAQIGWPRSVIAPDWMDEADRTNNATARLLSLLNGKPCAVGGVVQGRDLQERLASFKVLKNLGCSPICFPFRTPRAALIQTLREMHALSHNGWYHLLGLQELTDLSFDLTCPGHWSLDTAKPFKHIRLDQAESIRGHGRLNLRRAMTDQGRVLALWNIAYLRKLAGGRS